MSNVVRILVFAATGMCLLAACSSGPGRTVTTGDELARFDFSEPQTFEEGVYANATLRINDGVYRIALNQGDNEVWWAQWGDTVDNVVIDVEVEQLSEPNENAYGVACRLKGHVGQDVEADPTLAAIASGEAAEATEEPGEEATAEATAEMTEESTAAVEEVATTDEPAETESDEESDEEEAEAVLANGDGYLFLIQGNGSFAIMRARGRSILPLVDWTESSLINQGPASNELRAVCMDDYLALYINGEFAGDATDDTYSSGQVGLAASAANRLGVQVEFDNLIVHEAVSG